MREGNIAVTVRCIIRVDNLCGTMTVNVKLHI